MNRVISMRASVMIALAVTAMLLCVARPTVADEAPAWSKTPNPDYPLPIHLRGVHIDIRVTPDVIKHLADVWGVNYITLSMRPDAPGESPTKADPLRPYRKGLERLENVILPACKKNNVLVLFEFTPWGKVMNVADKLKREPAYWEDTPRGAKLRKWFPIMWKAMAKRLKDKTIIFAFDPLPEPNYSVKGDFGRHAWQEIMLPAVVKAIRSVNKTIWLEIAPGPWGSTSGYDTLKPVDDPYVIYGFHMYAPHRYTHQGLGRGHNVKRHSLTYPGMMKMFGGSPKIMWDKQTLAKYILPAVKFASANDARVLCGEFGVLRWAPGRKQWLTDVIDLFEQYDIGWSWHNPAGWNGWNLAFGPDAKSEMNTGMDAFNDGNVTPALRVVLDGLKKNKHE